MVTVTGLFTLPTGDPDVGFVRLSLASSAVLHDAPPGFIEMKTELRAQEQARALITGAVDAAKADFPSVFSDPTALEV